VGIKKLAKDQFHTRVAVVNTDNEGSLSLKAKPGAGIPISRRHWG